MGGIRGKHNSDVLLQLVLFATKIIPFFNYILRPEGGWPWGGVEGKADIAIFHE
jgi:hypothetical protein